MAKLVLLALALVMPVQAVVTNPIGEVVSLLSNLEAKISAEGVEADKAHAEMAAWCVDRKANVGFEIKTGESDVASLKATIEKQSSIISSGGTTVEELAASIATDEGDLKSATTIRAEEATTFAAEDKELSDVVDTLDRAIAVISREMHGGSLVQLSNVKNVAEALRIMVDASALSSADASRLTALVQSQNDDADAGAPDAATYVSHSGNIVDTLDSLKEKAEEQLADARRKETNARHNFEMLRQSLEDEIKFSNKEMADAKKAIAAASEEKAAAEGDLALTSKDLAADRAQAEDLASDCANKAQDYEDAKKSRAEELHALGEAKKVISEMTAGAEALSYSFLQSATLKSNADLAQFEAVRFVRDLAKKQHSAALAQLASRMASALKFGVGVSDGPFEKVKGLIADMISRLEEQGSADASHKAYCDEELSESQAKQVEKTAMIDKLSTQIDQQSSKSAQLKEQVAALEKGLAEIATAQAGMDKLRQEEHSAYTTNKADTQQGIQGVQMALKILREYYSKDGKAHAAAEGSSTGIIGLLEVCLSDFTKGLAEMMTTEDAAATSYARATRENELETTTKNQDVKYKSAEAIRLDKSVAEAKSDRTGAQDELDAVLQYREKLKEQCIAKAEPYAERKARRDAELAGLKQALEILDSQALLQDAKRGLRGVRQHA